MGLDRSVVHIDHPRQGSVQRRPGDHRPLLARAVAQANRNDAKRLGRQHPVLAGETEQGGARPGFDEAHRHIVRVRYGEAGVDHQLDPVHHRHGADQEGPRGRDPPHGQGRAPGPADDLAQYHARLLVEDLEPGDPCARSAGIVGRGRGGHRLRRVQGRGPPHRQRRAAHHRQHRHPDHGGVVGRVRLEQQEGEAVVFHIELRHAPAEPYPRRTPDQHTCRGDHGDQLEIVSDDVPVPVTEGFQQPDAGALDRDQPRNHDIDQEGRHQQEDGRQHPPHGRQLVDLAGHEGV